MSETTKRIAKQIHEIRMSAEVGATDKDIAYFVEEEVIRGKIEEVENCKIDKYVPPDDIKDETNMVDVANATIKCFNRWCDKRIADLTAELEGE